MTTPSAVDSLLAAVRRRMWRTEFAAAARLASWATAGLMLLAAGTHLALRPVGVGAVLLAIVVVWSAMAARAGWRRPSEPAAALWADRHLGGASAFSTWIEMRNGTQTAALAWLEHWVTARVPDSRRLLATRRDPARLYRPLLSMLVFAAFGLFVLIVPDVVAPPRPLVPSTPDGVERPVSEARPAAATELVGDLAQAVRSAASRRTADRGRAGAAPVEPSKIGDGAASPKARFESLTPDERATIATAPAARGDERALPTDAAGTSAAGAGRAAGESRDDRADAGSSQAARSTMPLAKRRSSAQRSPPSTQADMEQAATFGEDAAMARTTKETDRAPPAAPPPAAAATAQLTPTQAAYVQAWMRAVGQRR